MFYFDLDSLFTFQVNLATISLGATTPDFLQLPAGTVHHVMNQDGLEATLALLGKYSLTKEASLPDFLLIHAPASDSKFKGNSHICKNVLEGALDSTAGRTDAAKKKAAAIHAKAINVSAFLDCLRVHVGEGTTNRVVLVLPERVEEEYAHLAQVWKQVVAPGASMNVLAVGLVEASIKTASALKGYGRRVVMI